MNELNCLKGLIGIRTRITLFTKKVAQNFLLWSMFELSRNFTLLVLWLISAHIFDQRKDKACCPVFVFRRGISSAISDLILSIEWKLKCVINVWRYSLVPIFKISSCYARFYTFRNWEIFWNKPCLCDSDVVNPSKSVCICFVVSGACILDFYWEGKTMTCIL